MLDARIVDLGQEESKIKCYESEYYTFNTITVTSQTIFSNYFLYENWCVLIQMTLKIVPKGPVNNKSALFQIMAWHHAGGKPLSDPIMT